MNDKDKLKAIIEGAIIGSLYRLDERMQDVLTEPKLINDFVDNCTDDQVRFVKKHQMEAIIMCMSFYYGGFGQGERTILEKVKEIISK